MDSSAEQALLKKQAADYAAGLVESGMVVGLGTGSTAIFATRAIAERLQKGALREVRGFATSKPVWAEALALGIPMCEPDMPMPVDLTIDGADEVDPDMALIKGGGGALTWEKIVAQASARVVIVIDQSKESPRLGTLFGLPVEVLEFGWRSQARFLESLGARVKVRRSGQGAVFATDSGHMILDCAFGPIADAGALAAQLGARAGIVEHGLFVGIATDVVSAGAVGVRHRRRGGDDKVIR